MRVNWFTQLIEKGKYCIEFVTPDGEHGHTNWYDTSALAVMAFQKIRAKWIRDKQRAKRLAGSEDNDG